MSQTILGFMPFHVRYTCSGILQEQIVEFIMRNAQKYIIAREVASREHIQCYVEINITKKTWVNKFNLKFKNMDRRDKYVEPDKGKTKFYVCKENDILAHKGFTEEDIVQFREEYEKNHRSPPEIIFEETSKAPPLENKEKKKKKPTFMHECRNDLEDEYPDLEWDMKHRVIVFRKVMFKLGYYCRSLDHVIITRMTYGILNSLIKNKQEWLEYWHLKCFNEEFPTQKMIQEDFTLDE